MRIWHGIVGVVVAAILLALLRDDVGRVALVVFVAGLGEVVVGLFAILGLFRTLGRFGEARGPVAHLGAVGSTLLILAAASAAMVGLLWVGTMVVMRAVA